jgi:pimeloyl-ACP methyl ester carboxylesterase
MVRHRCKPNLRRRRVRLSRTPTIWRWQTEPVASEALANGLPNAQLQIFGRSGHVPFVDEADRFQRVVDDWLSCQPLERG